MSAIPPERQQTIQQKKIERVDRSQPLPLSLEQESMWVMTQNAHSTSGQYNISVSFRLDGRLNRGALQSAYRTIFNRHEALRTAFYYKDGQLLQSAGAPRSDALMLEQDLSLLPDAEQQAAVAQILRDEATKQFDLGAGVLFRGRLLRLKSASHVLILSQHHIVSDGWSCGILVNEISLLYEAFRRGLPDPLPPLEIQYADYAVWQRNNASHGAAKKQLDYWSSQLRDADLSLQLPTDHLSLAPSSSSASVELRLGPSLTNAIKRFSRRNAVTTFMTLLAGWSIFLSKICCQEDFVVGIPISNRPGPELRSIIGFFVNTLPLRLRVHANALLHDFMSQVKSTTLRGFANRDISFAQIVEAINPLRDSRRNPVFQVIFNFDNAPGERIPKFGGLRVYPLPPAQTNSALDLVLNLRESADAIDGSIEYSTNIFDRSTVERFAVLLIQLLQELAIGDDKLVGDLGMLPPSERERVLLTFNRTACTYPSALLIHHLFEDAVANSPNIVAAAYRGQSLSYGELNTRANQVAVQLRDMGVGPDSFVGLYVGRGLEMIVGIFGILKAGGAYVPLDPAYPAERIKYMLADSQPTVVITTPELLPTLLSTSVRTLCIEVGVAEASGSIAVGTNNLIVPGITSSNLAYLIYTSGSTGDPKGVMVEHRNLVASTSARSEFCKAGDRHLLLSSVSFDSSVALIFGALTSLGTLVVASDPLDLREVRREIARWHITHVLAVPSFLRLLFADDETRPLESLRQIISAGESCPKALVEAVARCAPQASLVNEYGPTETTVWATVHVCETTPRGNTVPIGRPIKNAQIYILDERNEPVPIGVPGEIHIAGAGVSRGYLNRPQMTAERFIRDPFTQDPTGLMYKTGDLGRWQSDGTIEYLGRNDQQIKLRGHRIEPGEIDACLRRNPAVLDAVVLPYEQEPQEKQLVAYIVFQAGQDVPVSMLREELSKTLPEHMIPSVFVFLKQIPLTPNGKVDRKALPAPTGLPARGQLFEAPVGKLEEAIARHWETLLSVDKIGRHDNFFELGGHSLLLVHFVGLLEREFPIKVSVASVFKAPTAEKLAALINGSSTEGRYKHVVKLSEGGFRPPLFCLSLVEGDTSAYVHLARFIDPSIPVYGLNVGYTEETNLTDGTLDRLTDSYQEEIRRIQPKGPYRICGFSFGGASAFEVARNLEIAGEEVTLVLLDAYPFSKTVVILDWIMRILRTIREHEVLATLKMKLRKLFIYKNHRWLTGKDKDLTHALMRRAMHRRYTPFSGSAILFKSSGTTGDSYLLELDHRNGWGKYVRGPFEVIRLPAGHHDLMKEPSVHSLVDHLNRLLK